MKPTHKNCKILKGIATAIFCLWVGSAAATAALSIAEAKIKIDAMETFKMSQSYNPNSGQDVITQIKNSSNTEAQEKIALANRIGVAQDVMAYGVMLSTGIAYTKTKFEQRKMENEVRKEEEEKQRITDCKDIFGIEIGGV